jgi:hypothetical protein
MEIESKIPAAQSPQNWTRRIEAEIAAVAVRQHGVVSISQLGAMGLSPRATRDRVAAGRLHRIHRGVFAVGHPRITREGHWMAAVLSGGDGSALSHQGAGANQGLRTWTGRPTITVPSWRASTRDIEFHASPIPADEITIVDAIPTTTVPRTIFDLASVLDRHDLSNVIREAEIQHLTDALSLPGLLERHPGRRGAANLRAILADLDVGKGIADGELEDRFQRFLAEEALPLPEINAPIHLGDRFIVADCLWREHRLIVELDGHDVHDRRIQGDSDKERDRDLMLLGWRVIRVTWRHLHQGRRKLARDLGQLLRSSPT